MFLVCILMLSIYVFIFVLCILIFDILKGIHCIILFQVIRLISLKIKYLLFIYFEL